MGHEKEKLESTSQDINIYLESTYLEPNIEKNTCSCLEAVDKFIISTSVENENFRIQGSFYETKTIHITYFGKLTYKPVLKEIEDITSSSEKNIYIYYCFDNKWDEKKIIKMSKCKRHLNQSYCSNIYLPNKGILYVAFTDNYNNWDTDTNSPYFFKVYEDKEKEIIKRYCLDSQSSTTQKKSSSLTMYNKNINVTFRSIIIKIKNFFKDILSDNLC